MDGQSSKWGQFYLEVVHSLQVQGMRRGQAYFNALHKVDPDLANSIRGTNNDPFYSDHALQGFITTISEAWDNADHK